jgi:pyruvate formate lyase activating enzyme
MIQKPESLSRRSFCHAALTAGSCLAAGAGSPSYAGILDKLFKGNPEKQITQNDAPKELWKWSKEAYNYIVLGKNVECKLCPNECKMEPESRSKCKVRVHKNQKLYSLVYGNPAAIHIDPIEKKPLYHFFPRSRAFSLGFAGCNFQCLNCQNWELSQEKPEDLKNVSLFPEEAVAAAGKNNCLSIAYTYNEPSVVYEYMLDTAKLARNRGIKNVWVSNGYINREPLVEYCKYLDGANVDLKSFSEAVYQKLNYGKLQPVLDTLLTLKEHDVWFEITNLMVPTYSDDMAMIREMCRWINKYLGPNYPLHFSRFGPKYKLEHLPPTPPSKLMQAWNIAREEGLNFVYLGNYRTPDGKSSHTFCPHCGETVIERVGYLITKYSILDHKCANCETQIPGRW